MVWISKWCCEWSWNLVQCKWWKDRTEYQPSYKTHMGVLHIQTFLSIRLRKTYRPTHLRKRQSVEKNKPKFCYTQVKMSKLQRLTRNMDGYERRKIHVAGLHTGTSWHFDKNSIVVSSKTILVHSENNPTTLA